jgi:tetratricopeptide (TPR) repeat protein
MKTSELAELLDLKTEPTQLFFLAEAGYLWLDLGHADKARAIFESLGALCPDDPTGHLGSGDACLAEGRYREAAAAFKKATQAPCILVATLAFAYRKLGDAWLMADQPQQAVKAWRAASEVQPSGSEGELARNKIQCLEQGLTLKDMEALLVQSSDQTRARP